MAMSLRNLGKPIVRKVGAAQRVNDPMLAGMLASGMAGRKFRKAPDISDGQYNRLPPKVKAHIDAVLDDAAKLYKCPKRDLVWRMKNGVIHVKKREVIRIS